MATPESLLTALYPFVPLLSSQRRFNPDVSKKVRRYLNALALISVARPAGDVIAVTLATRKEETALYIATNGGVSQSVVDHLRAVWRCLRQISRGPAGSSSDSKGFSQELRMEIVHRIYHFTWKKFQRRFNKRAPVFLESVRRLIGEMSDQDPALLKNIESSFLKIGALTRLGTPEDSDIDSLVEQLDAIQSTISNLYGTIQYDVRRYLKKVLALRNHINDLLSVGWDKKFQSMLSAPLRIVPIPAMSRQFMVNLDDPAFVLHCFGSQEEVHKARPRWIRDVLNKVRLELTKKKHISTLGDDTYSCAEVYTHCECALVVYLQDHSEVNPIRFIGVSKLCCQVCFTFIRVYKLKGRIRYQYAGTHGKIYLPYVFPELPDGNTPNLDAEVRNEILKILTEDFQEGWTQKHKGRQVSDSTAASFMTSDDEESKRAVDESESTSSLRMTF
ncbi:hypothetical protein HETIRDRAFT_480888 [Heterobasidion irregulare TC 32-1]|uniref:Uncharacterized protein n=1 Tax=Heterobasidion irregulare (strain TC 32-1) TaxID=747525 RepID=W4JV41_HETIT|nr:uncharacterized protein HETIRDRAFT_480888 [Heterobasidion irregulare TC 32-1]ETW76746.1 hypothetical protein HETIRDRAFT_480888 [Heterobasidion irregulare TC 32-1]